MTRTHRAKCFEAKGKRCHFCGDSDTVQVHHVDGDRENNDLNNLLPVCPSCHAKIHAGSDGFEKWHEKLPDSLDTSDEVPDRPEAPPTPDLPNYIVEAIENQGPERLETIVSWASKLLAHKRTVALLEEEYRKAKKEQYREALAERGLSTDPADYEGVPAKAYLTAKETSPGSRYLYWQWRDGDSVKSKYVAPVNPAE